MKISEKVTHAVHGEGTIVDIWSDYFGPSHDAYVVNFHYEEQQIPCYEARLYKTAPGFDSGVNLIEAMAGGLEMVGM